ncbi:YeiH family protein [Paenibacillus sp. MBLB4367]|uniref:YeiH family protein n=1 Tax=Paenibacillus sp. MBLB4367 TaxID=3384767 RepID=UPI0039080BF1
MKRIPDNRLHRTIFSQPAASLKGPQTAPSRKTAWSRIPTNGITLGLALTVGLAVIAKLLASLPYLTIMGQLVLAIVLGMVWRASVGVPVKAAPGIAFSSKKLLRLGIILLGMRLNWSDIAGAGPKAAAIAAINIAFALGVVYLLARLLGVDSRLGMLTACGTAICGAAAVVAVSPQLKATDEETAVAAATIAVLGTMFTLAYTFLYPVLGLSPYGYGVFAGGTLHEIAHAIAAAAPGGGEAVDTAVVVKLTRVAMLVPVAVLIGVWAQRKERRKRVALSADGHSSSSEEHAAERSGFLRSLPIPWFIFGFLAVSGLHSLDVVPQRAADLIVVAAYMLIASAMAGLGLNVDAAAFRRLGARPFAASLIGSLLLAGLGYVLVLAFGMA